MHFKMKMIYLILCTTGYEGTISIFWSNINSDNQNQRFITIFRSKLKAKREKEDVQTKLVLNYRLKVIRDSKLSGYNSNFEIKYLTERWQKKNIWF